MARAKAGGQEQPQDGTDSGGGRHEHRVLGSDIQHVPGVFGQQDHQHLGQGSGSHQVDHGQIGMPVGAENPESLQHALGRTRRCIPGFRGRPAHGDPGHYPGRRQEEHYHHRENSNLVEYLEEERCQDHHPRHLAQDKNKHHESVGSRKLLPPDDGRHRGGFGGHEELAHSGESGGEQEYGPDIASIEDEGGDDGGSQEVYDG